MALTKAVPFKPFDSAETPKACALVGLHLLAAEDGAVPSGSQSPDLGDMWVCPESLDWDSDVESWTEHNVEGLALNEMEQDQSGEKISLFWKIGNLPWWH